MDSLGPSYDNGESLLSIGGDRQPAEVPSAELTVPSETGANSELEPVSSEPAPEPPIDPQRLPGDQSHLGGLTALEIVELEQSVALGEFGRRVDRLMTRREYGTRDHPEVADGIATYMTENGQRVVVNHDHPRQERVAAVAALTERDVPLAWPSYTDAPSLLREEGVPSTERATNQVTRHTDTARGLLAKVIHNADSDTDPGRDEMMIGNRTTEIVQAGATMRALARFGFNRVEVMRPLVSKVSEVAMPVPMAEHGFRVEQRNMIVYDNPAGRSAELSEVHDLSAVASSLEETLIVNGVLPNGLREASLRVSGSTLTVVDTEEYQQVPVSVTNLRPGTLYQNLPTVWTEAHPTPEGHGLSVYDAPRGSAAAGRGIDGNDIVVLTATVSHEPVVVAWNCQTKVSAVVNLDAQQRTNLAQTIDGIFSAIPGLDDPSTILHVIARTQEDHDDLTTELGLLERVRVVRGVCDDVPMEVGLDMATGRLEVVEVSLDGDGPTHVRGHVYGYSPPQRIQRGRS